MKKDEQTTIMSAELSRVLTQFHKSAIFEEQNKSKENTYNFEHLPGQQE